MGHPAHGQRGVRGAARNKRVTELLDAVGRKNIMFETDYPHSDSTWPHSAETAQRLMGHLDQETVNKLCRGNAIELLGLDLVP